METETIEETLEQMKELGLVIDKVLVRERVNGSLTTEIQFKKEDGKA